MNQRTYATAPVRQIPSAKVHCPMCTHSVDAALRQMPLGRLGTRRIVVAPGQRCPRCNGSLDAAPILRLSPAA